MTRRRGPGSSSLSSGVPVPLANKTARKSGENQWTLNADFAKVVAARESRRCNLLQRTLSKMSFRHEAFNVDRIIKQLLEARKRASKQSHLSELEIRQLCLISRDIFLRQPMLVELESPVNVVGDIHGQYEDLLRHFDKCGYPPDANYLFLGDYVDRGKNSLETICLVLAYKIKFPHNFFLLRGNHESANINRIYGFYDECKRRYSIKLWKTFTDCFNCLPVAALIEGSIFCTHGGLSPELHNLDQIRHIPRPIEVPEEGLVCDLLWSDPDEDINGWGENDRGVSYIFGGDVVNHFLEKHDCSLIVRAHQVVEDGYQFFQKRKLVTIFSAPNYCGEFDNAGAIMILSEDLTCRFSVLPPDKSKFANCQLKNRSHKSVPAILAAKSNIFPTGMFKTNLG